MDLSSSDIYAIPMLAALQIWPLQDRREASIKDSTAQPAPSLERRYVGATIFIGYIVAALFLTFNITYHLHTAYNALPTSTRSEARFRRKLFLLSGLSLLSFTMLSATMLSVLIVSYTSWSALSPSSTTVPSPLLSRIWLWTVTTPHFTSFARGLVADPVSTWWSGTALNATLLSHIYMGVLGRRHGLPHLLQYFLIAQILPVSFAQSLALVGILLQRARAQAQVARGGKNGAPAGPWTILMLAGVYRALLESMPGLRETANFVPLVLVLRLLLFSGYFVTLPDDEMADRLLRSVVRWFGPVSLAHAAFLQVGWGEDTMAGLLQVPAVAALGMDLLVWVTVIYSSM